MGRTACTDPQCLYSTTIPLLPLCAVQPVQTLSACTVHLYLYSPYRPYRLHRPSMPVEYSYTATPPVRRTACTDPQCLYSTAIPLLTLCAVQPVQILRACTYSYTSTPPVRRTACTDPQCLYIMLNLYSLCAPHGLYRASVPVQYSYTSTPPMGRTACTNPHCLYSTTIPLLSLWAVRPVQSLSACTVELYLYTPIGRTACTDPQCCTVQLYLYSPCAPYSLYRPSVPVQYNYTSTPPVRRTACTEPQYLYKDALYLLF